MDTKTYAQQIKRTLSPIEDDFLSQLHMVIGITTESAELLDAYKKKLAYGKQLDIVNIGEEIGDIMWYLVNLLEMLDIKLDDVLEVNVKKLMARYPNKFTESAAINRDLSAERSILNSIVEK